MNKPGRSEAKTPYWRTLSAGLITGAADDDPSGIATYSQVGAAYGYNTMWSVLVALPLMIAIQMISARIGRVTGAGVAAGLRKRYGHWLVYCLVSALLVANIINLGADIGAMGAALKLLVGGPALAYTAVFVLLSIALQVFVPFSYYSPILKLLTLSLFAYVATVFAIKVPWSEVAKGVFLPHITLDAKYAMAIVAVLGTTISPYLFFWQAAQEVEEVRDVRNPRRPLMRMPLQGPSALRRIGIDTVAGMFVSEIVAFFIILTAAVVLHAHGKTDITSSAEAAAALRPLAGRFASVLFAAGIIGTGLLAVPVLAGSAAYGGAEAFGKPSGLQHIRCPGAGAQRASHRSGQGALLECGDQWGRRGSDHGRDHGVQHELARHGQVRSSIVAADPGLDRNLGHDRSGRRDVRDLGQAVKACPVPASGRVGSAFMAAARHVESGF